MTRRDRKGRAEARPYIYPYIRCGMREGANLHKIETDATFAQSAGAGLDCVRRAERLASEPRLWFP